MGDVKTVDIIGCAIGLVVKYLVAIEMPRVRFPDGAIFCFIFVLHLVDSTFLLHLASDIFCLLVLGHLDALDSYVDLNYAEFMLVQ